MAVTEGRVPGGRQGAASCEQLSMEVDDFDNDLSTTGLSPEHRNVSQSLPKFVGHQVNNTQITTNCLEPACTQTLDRKKKARTPSFKFGNFMQKMVRQMSIHSPKTRKKRSQSMTRESERYRNGDDVDLSLSPAQTSGESPPALVWEKGKVPGVAGIRNHGNTCFMNSVIQCLGHTDLLVKYFITDNYKHDIKRNNKQHARKYGTKGELTEHLAVLLKSIWTCQYSASLSSDFKAVVGKHGSQYKGFAQHDAQEFLMWLLDKLHEDLNVASKKKFKTNKSHGRHDDTADMLANHMRCNNSYVYDLFQAVYRSSLTCPNCRRQSNTFDPFLSVSLPIPQKTRRPLFVTVVYHDAQPKQVRIGLLMEQCQTVRDLRQTLASDTKIPESQLLLTEMYVDGFHRTFHDSQPLSDIQETDSVYAVEMPELSSEIESSDHNLEFLTLLVINVRGTAQDGKRFGSPVVIRIQREAGYSELQNELLSHMISSFKDSIVTQSLGVLFRLRMLDGLPGQCYLPHDVEHPLYMPTVDRALSCCIPGSGPEHVKVVAEWDQQTKPSILSNAEDIVEEHTSVRQVQLAHDQPVLGTLDECFQLYTQDEKLNGDDAWHCPNCRRRQQGTIKAINLWSLPDILVIHLKRFKQEGTKRNKLNTLITFPITGLDLTQHACERNHSNQHSNKPSITLSPWRRSRQNPGDPDDYIFDLYAVCNHYGNMQGGHYTAFCRNVADSKWYTYDDTKVTEMAEEDVVTRAAYLLFYHRRSVQNNNVTDASHWLHQLSRINIKGPKVKQSKSHEDLLEDPAQGQGHNTFSRSLQAYATLRVPVPKASSADIKAESVVTTSDPPTPVSIHGNTRGLTVGQLARHREQQKSPRSESSPKVNSLSPNPGTPSSVRSEGSDYDNLSPSFEHCSRVNGSSPRWQPTAGPQRSLVRQNSTPLEAINNHSQGRQTCIKSPSFDCAYGTTKGMSPVRVTPLSKLGTPPFRTRRSDTFNSDSSFTTSNSAPLPNSRRPLKVAVERTRVGLTRSLTSPEVAVEPGETVSRRANSQDRKMKKWDYSKTVFLQESCV